MQPKRTDSITSPAGKLTVLSVSPIEEDHSSLQSIIHHANSMLFKARDLVSALNLLHKQEIAVVFCERDLFPGGTWVDVLEQMNTLPTTPSLIVTSRLADDRLWSEVLNRNGWDVLAKPFDPTEVLRSMKSAWQHWLRRSHIPTPTVMKAAS